MAWLQTLIRVESERAELRADMIVVTQETRYYITSLLEEAKPLAQRIRGYWGVENKVHFWSRKLKNKGNDINVI